MRIESIEIRRAESYEMNPGLLVGDIFLKDRELELRILLSHGCISKIVNLVLPELERMVTEHQKKIKYAVDEATDELFVADSRTQGKKS